MRPQKICGIMEKEVSKMRDFPIFDTPYGIASLVLKEIPYQGNAFITLQSTQEPELLLKECVDFCRVCGAQRIYATGADLPQGYPLYTTVIRMVCHGASLPETDAAVFPVQSHTLEQWRGIYNQKVIKVPNGAWMTEKDAKRMLDDGSGYFVHRNGKLLGIGKVSGSELEWVASVMPGAGRDVVCALSHAACADKLELTVASTNPKALKLYRELGFLPTQEISRWYTVYPK